ncbi:MAG: hypothetical protein K0U34_07640 [Alphaproteobacteria bacterium]|nr:hypothetical protein [Alphaproteobacteria bacterium]
MPTKHSRRGRPKGSGLDDTRHLATISEMIAANPDLKPTTAIRSLGISDPSTIRRLRDKYRKFKQTPQTTSAKFDQQPSQSVQSERRVPTPAPVSETPRPVVHATRQSRQNNPQNGLNALEAAAEPISEPAKWFNAWCGLGLQTLSTTLEINTAAYTNLVALPPVAFAWKQQFALNELAIDFYKKQKPQLACVH